MNRIKEHFKKYRTEYILGTMLFAGITWAIVKPLKEVFPRDASLDLLRGSNSHGSVDARVFNFLGRVNSSPVVSLHSGTRGHPGFVTRCIDDGNIFHSQGEAARFYEIFPSVLSGHLNGKLPDASGKLFERTPIG